jgi:hypothetical protein
MWVWCLARDLTRRCIVEKEDIFQGVRYGS